MRLKLLILLCILTFPLLCIMTNAEELEIGCPDVLEDEDLSINIFCENTDCDGLPEDMTECCCCLYRSWDDNLKKYTERLCNRKDIPYQYVLGIIWNESRFQSDVTSEHAGYTNYGLMQVNGITFDFLQDEIGLESEDELLDPKTNILAGITLLDYHRDYVTNDKEMILRYQVGESNYQNMIENGEYSMPCLERVLDKAEIFKLVI